MIFIAVGGRNYRRAKYKATGIPPKIAWRIGRVRSAQQMRLANEFSTTRKGKKLLAALKKTAAASRSDVDNLNLRPGNARLEAIADRSENRYCRAKLDHLKALLEFMQTKRNVYTSLKCLLAQDIAELEAYLHSR